MSRDKELDDLTQELMGAQGPKPFLHRPDEIKVEEGAVCWLHPVRACGADCMAFDPEPDQQSERCRVLQSLGKLDEGMVTLGKLIKLYKRDKDDATRPAPKPPPTL